MTHRPLGAQISHMLKARGVDTIFGIPGVHNVEMYRGIEEAGITHVLARHEQGAGFMADGYARATGRVGVAYVITGPGLCNIMTALGQAYSDSVSVLTLSSCLDETAARKGQLHQMLDQRGAADTVCDWSLEARSPEAAYELVDRALTEFATMRPRPKHIQVGIDVLGGVAPAPKRVPAHPVQRTRAQLDMSQVADILNAATQPMVVVGGGAIQAMDGLRQLTQTLKAASFATYAGRGVISSEDPLHFGTYLARPSSAEVIAQADVVLAVGTELSEVDLWRTDLGHTGTMIRIDIDPSVLSNCVQTTLGVHADAQNAIDSLVPLLAAKSTSAWRAETVAQTRAHWKAEVDAERPGIVPIVDALRAVMPADTMIYSDMTQFAYAATEVWDLPHPGHWHHPYGFGTLGYGLPAAIGGAVARGKAPTVCIAGDYGFQYTIQELGTAVELGLSLPILLWDNGKLKEIEDSMVNSQIAPNAVVAMNPDFCKLAEAYGALACEPETLAELQQAVLDALQADRPTLIRMTPALTA